VWDSFKERFRIPQILEFYAATEGGVSLFNVQENGRDRTYSAYLAHRFSPALVQFDWRKTNQFEMIKGSAFVLLRMKIGEAIGKCVVDPSHIGSRFEG